MEVNKVYKLEPVPDRRKQSRSVEVERRLGVDRRKNPRLVVSSKFKQEILQNKAEKVDPAKIYNLEYLEDRRKQHISVKVDRRSGTDRRTTQRLTVNKRLKEDINTFKPVLVLTQVGNQTILNPTDKKQLIKIAIKAGLMLTGCIAAVIAVYFSKVF